MDALQKLIHRLEVGGGMRYFRLGITVLALLLLWGGYNWRAFKNMSTQEAMDASQVARNLAQGNGYSTLFIRPLSIHLVEARNRVNNVTPQQGSLPDPALLRGMHPDLANPPLYPLLLAGLMKVLPFEWTISGKPSAFWTYAGNFWRYQPDFLIAAFNQLLFFGVVGLVFLLGRRLFDKHIAAFAALLLLGTELLWRFSASGLSTMLLMLIFTALVWCLVLFDEETQEARWGRFGVLGLAAMAGVLVGAGALTRYAFAAMIVPVLAFVVLSMREKRILLGAITFIGFAVVLGPWIGRNYVVSDTAFGTAGYALVEGTAQFPENRLQRSLKPDFSVVRYSASIKEKLITGCRHIVQNELPKLGGSWVSGFFLVGLLVGLQQPSARRLRYFLVAALVVLALTQALGRTQLSVDSPEINSENLLVLLVPFVMLYGTSLFYMLLDQMHLPFREMRYVATGLFAVLACLPMILTLLPLTFNYPLAFPPYHPPSIQESTQWRTKDDLMMSDVPWAVAWYGGAQCMWMSSNSGNDFFDVNDYYKSIETLYFTRVTIDGHFLKEFSPAWGPVLLQVISQLGGQEAGVWPKRVNLQVKLADQAASTLPLHFLQKGSTLNWPDSVILTSRAAKMTEVKKP
jgi:4-amino-4-deoxy-L-arabinose transferase-like glycosyltransferase